MARAKNRLVAVRFRTSCDGYTGGERAGFPADQAARYVRSGAAEYLVTDVPAAPVTKTAAPAPPPPPPPAPKPEPEPEKPQRKATKKKAAKKKATRRRKTED
jgi:hypothetical protein